MSKQKPLKPLWVFLAILALIATRLLYIHSQTTPTKPATVVTSINQAKDILGVNPHELQTILKTSKH